MDSKHVKYAILVLVVLIVLILIAMVIYNLVRVNNNKSMISKVKTGYQKNYGTTSS